MQHSKFFLFAFLLLFIACKDEATPVPELNIIKNIKVLDTGQQHNAGDLTLVFNVDDINGITQLRIFLVKSSGQSSFDNNTAVDLPVSNYQAVSNVDIVNRVRLKESLLDANGNTIEKDVIYNVFFLVLKGDATFLDQGTTEALISNEHYLSAKFRGTWDDNFYTNFGISADLTFSNGWVSGPFYYTAGFNPCCGGNDDGTIRFKVENDSLLNFTYAQDLLTYMNGCPGSYSGKGILENLTTLKIDFSGDDCDGRHENGKIVLQLIE